MPLSRARTARACTYRTDDNPTALGAINDGKDEGVIYNQHVGCFTPAPGGKQGFIWFNNQVVNPVKMDNGKVSSVEQTNWLKGEMTGPVGVIINGESVFMMNGQTGQFVGSLPIDQKKLQLYTALSFIITFLVLFGIIFHVA